MAVFCKNVDRRLSGKQTDLSATLESMEIGELVILALETLKKEERKGENVRKGYLQGRFGAIPFIGGDTE